MALLPISRENRGSFDAELRSLEAERDPELKAEGLFHLARRAEAGGDHATAAQLYRQLEETPLAQRAAERIRVLGGQGNFGDRAEILLQNFSKEAVDPSTLFAMGAAGALFKATRLIALSRLVSAPASIFTRGFGARALASTAAFAVEAPAFPLVARMARSALGYSQDWSANALGHEIASSVLVLGGMKLGGLASTSLAKTIGGGAAGISNFTRGAFQQSGMLGGILLGHRFEEIAGIRPATPMSWAEAFATLLQFNVAGRLTQAAFGQRFGRWEREVEGRTQLISANPSFPTLGGTSFGSAIPVTALAGAGHRGAQPVEIRGPEILMMKGESGGSGSSVERLPPMVEISFLQLRNPDLAMAESHLFHLEYLLHKHGLGLKPREYVNLYTRLHSEVKSLPHGLNRDATNILSETLVLADLNRPGPQMLFKQMIHIERFADYSMGDTLMSWARNHTLQSRHRRKLLQLAGDIFEGRPSNSSEEALGMLANGWHRLHCESRAFQQALNSAIRFLNAEDAWFHGRFNGIDFAEAALLDPALSERSRDLILVHLQAALHNSKLGSPQRVRVLQALEGLLQRSDLTAEQREVFEGRLPIWRNELLYFVEKSAPHTRLHHYAELAYLLAQDYVPLMQKQRFANDLQRAFFSASPDSQAYALMFADALRYVSDPNLQPEFRQTFVMQLLKALNDSIYYQPQPFERDVHKMNQQFIITRINSLPDEERVQLAHHLIDDLKRRDGRAERAAVLISTLASMMNPTEDLRRRLSLAADNSHTAEARAVAEFILERWQSLN